MDIYEYDRLTAPLLSDQFHTELVSQQQISGLLDSIQSIAGRVKAVKKALYYGSALSSGNSEWLARVANHHDGFDVSRINPKMLHAALGLFDEACEMLQHLANVARGDEEFDSVNWREELGDAEFFLAVGAREDGATLEDIMAGNIRKLFGDAVLPGRYKEGVFSTKAANIRDLQAERAALGSSAPASANIQEE